METRRFRDLTEGQRACLRLVYQHRSSKEIARTLGISKDTVDQRLDRARKLLGAVTRIEAALAFKEWEREYDRVVYDTLPLAPAVASAAPTESAICREPRTQQRLTLHDVHESYRMDFDAQEGKLGSILRLRLGSRNDLALWQRLICIAAIAVAVPLVLGSLVVGLWALGQIASELQQ